jgi:putative PIN family toxin of toxin-antitoxin system
MRVILDTNVLLGALISPYGPPEAIYRAWRLDRFELVTSTVQLDEIRRVSRYPKLKPILPAHRIGTMVNNMQRASVLGTLPALPEGITVADPDDGYLLAMALASEADYLVTGDRRAGLLQMQSAARTRIVTPSAFCEEVL